MPFDESLLIPFSGYFDLGMYAEANDELDCLSPEVKSHPKVLHARLAILVEMERWEDGAILGLSLAKLWPQEHKFHFKAAYCLHELKRTREARDALLAAPSDLRKIALFFYNLACYEAQLGRLGEAKQLLQRCFELEMAWRAEALDDPDLGPVWQSS